jgi:hypothetical protein
MWLVAPQIPTSVREFLDRIGIEYSEIHLPEFRQVADRRGFVLHSEAARTQSPPNSHPIESPASEGEARLPVLSSGLRREPKVIYKNFKDVMERAVLSLRAANPSHVRLDGKTVGSNGKTAFQFQHQGKTWAINYDTHYDRLLLAYEAIKDDSVDPFVEMATKTEAVNVACLSGTFSGIERRIEGSFPSSVRGMKAIYL